MNIRKAQALHDLICTMLRGPHIRRMPGADIAAYTYKAGVALHNLPVLLATNETLHVYLLQEIDELDPKGGGGQWGPWVVKLCCDIGQALPEYQKQIA